jgi:ABC-2 type transport system permease protein
MLKVVSCQSRFSAKALFAKVIFSKASSIKSYFSPKAFSKTFFLKNQEENMTPIFFKEFKLSLRPLVIWTSIMFLTAAFGMAEFYSLKDNLDVLMNGVSGMPRIVRIVFGVDAIPINTPLGCLACMQYFYGIIAFCFAASTGVFVVGKDERYKTADFLYTKPYGRSLVIGAKLMVAFIDVLVMAVVSLIGSLLFLVPLFPGANLASASVAFTIGLFLSSLVFLVAGTLCASLLKDHGQATLRSFLALALCYAIAFFVEFSGNISFLGILTPVRWFSPQAVTESGISAVYAALAIALFAAGAWHSIKSFSKRDLRA